MRISLAFVNQSKFQTRQCTFTINFNFTIYKLTTHDLEPIIWCVVVSVNKHLEVDMHHSYSWCLPACFTISLINEIDSMTQISLSDIPCCLRLVSISLFNYGLFYILGVSLEHSFFLYEKLPNIIHFV